MFFAYVLLGQIVVASIVVLVLKKTLDNILIDSAIRQLELLSQEKKTGVQAVTVVTHKDLKVAYQERLKRATLKQLGAAAALSFQIDKSLLGGMVIKVGAHTIDCSLRDRLRQARR